MGRRFTAMLGPSWESPLGWKEHGLAIHLHAETHGHAFAGDVHLRTHVRETIGQFFLGQLARLDERPAVVEGHDQLGRGRMRRAIRQVAESKRHCAQPDCQCDGSGNL